MLVFWIWTNKTLLFLYITCLILQKTLVGVWTQNSVETFFWGVFGKKGIFLDSYICQKVVKIVNYYEIYVNTQK